MLLRLIFDSDTMGVDFGLGLSKDLERRGMKIVSCIEILNNQIYHGWEGQTGVIMINVHLFLIALANTLPIRAKGGRRMLLGVSSVFEMHPPSMHVNLVASLCILGSRGTTWVQTLVLKPVSVSEMLTCLISICLTNFSFPWKSLPGILQ